MLRLISISFSAFLLLSALSIQNVQAQLPQLARGASGLARVTQAAQAFVRAPSGVQAISAFTSTSSAAQGMISLAASYGMVVNQSTNLADALAWMDSSRKKYAELDMRIAEIESMGGYSEFAELEQGLKQLSRTLGIDLSSSTEDFYAQFTTPTEATTNNAVVAPARTSPLPSLLSDSVAARQATADINKDVVIDAVGNAYITRGSMYGIPQMVELGGRLRHHLKQLAVVFLGPRAEECVINWPDTLDNNEAIMNLGYIGLSTSTAIRTISQLREQLPQLFHAVIDRGIKGPGQALTNLMNAPLVQAVRARLQENVNTVAGYCGLINPAAATASI